MKIRQVCQKTGLSERTIRFYIEKGLIHPHAEEMNERTYYEYSDSDVSMLIQISALRKTRFSIDDILEMQQSPEKTNIILHDHMKKLRADNSDSLEAIKTLERLGSNSYQSITDLGRNINKSAARLTLPAADTQPNFARFDNVTPQEQKQALAGFEAAQRRSYVIGKSIIITIAIVNALACIASSFVEFNLFTIIIQLVLSVALVCGFTWVRYLYASGSALGALMLLYLLFGADGISSLPAFGIIILVAYLAFSIASSVVLFVSKGVSDFLYVQKNG